MRFTAKPHCLMRPSFERKEIIFRKLRSLDRDVFIQDIKNSALFKNESTDKVSELAICYDNALRSLLDKHAPLKKRIVTVRPSSPWYSDDIRLAKAKRRRLERQWRRTRLTVHREMYVDQCTHENKLIYDSRMQFYSNRQTGSLDHITAYLQ